jgi:hypothetical protein
MTALLITGIISFLIFVYFMMCCLDNFIGRGGIIDSPQGRFNHGVLIYGSKDIIEKLKKFDVNYRYLINPVFPDDGFYLMIFSMSPDDEKNLSLCLEARHSDPDIYIVAQCRSPYLHNVFKDVGANCIINSDDSIDGILSEIWGKNR